jgi:glycerol transport system ATP-binding protein
LFERPRHTFVGYFIGSPGMNVLPCTIDNGTPRFAGLPVEVQNPPARSLNGQRLEIGVRPEFVSFAEAGIPVDVTKVSDAGRYRIVEACHAECRIKLLVQEGTGVPSAGARVRFDPGHTRLYADGRLVE